jgi:hypothetical protein
MTNPTRYEKQLQAVLATYTRGVTYEFLVRQAGMPNIYADVHAPGSRGATTSTVEHRASHVPRRNLYLAGISGSSAGTGGGVAR